MRQLEEEAKQYMEQKYDNLVYDMYTVKMLGAPIIKIFQTMTI